MREIVGIGRDPLVQGRKIHQAIMMAAMAHKGQIRKGTQVDYLVHPMEVLAILTAMQGSVELRIAGILHDTVEDTDLTIEEIRQHFGSVVAQLVAGHTENKKGTWHQRKQDHIDKLYRGTKDHKKLVLADSLSNIRSMVQDYEMVGDALWQRFKAPRQEQAWYYHSMREAMADMVKDCQTAVFYEEMATLCYEVFPKSSY